MKKASLFASAAVVSALGLTAVPAFAQAGGPFADVPTDHWAYESVDQLQRRGIVIGYPDGTYGGKRAMTRYEFAVAIARLVQQIRDPVPPPPPAGGITKQQLDEAIAGLATKADLAGLATREEVDQIRKLVNEFQNELTTLGVEVDNVRRRLDGVENRLGLLEQEFRRVRIGGGVNLMARGNHRLGNTTATIRDRDGFVVTGGPGSRGSILADSRVLHDIDLDIRARLGDTATASVKLNFGNYLPFLNSVSSFAGVRSDNPVGPGGFGTGGVVTQRQEQTVYEAMVEAPIRLPLLGGVNLAVGRIPLQFTPYTLKLIDVDTYFANDKTDLGDIPMDGGRATFQLGPVGVTTFAAKVDPIRFVSNVSGTELFGRGLFAGASRAPFSGAFATGIAPGTSGFTRPTQSLISEGRPEDNGAMPIEQIAGARATFGTGFLGTIGATYLIAGGPATTSPGLPAAANFDRVEVYGADINTNLAGFGLTGSYTVSNTRAGFTAGGAPLTGGDMRTVRNRDTYAWEAAASYSLGSLNLGAGYREIAPFFAAPGYWGKIGAWTNPVDIRGPFVRASFALGGGIALVGEGHFYEGTGKAAGAGGLTQSDEIESYRLGLKYGLTSASAVDLGVEHTRFRIAGVGPRPRETFYNIGYGFSFNPATSLKFLYQVVDYSDQGTGFDPVPAGRGGVAAAQFSVKF